ncbi:hypothetical protein H2199_004399 [Coniosporium tulheliwenetii]|uniref:Uncharacterized protein n=1 Tax=Coniosporium tulheliwenetii TaxID=3383036 RepID=A0ACC2Z580_9PEZI|nr:hypothetical protein H2199_004399 [Cladosporium sp. JES 115]
MSSRTLSTRLMRRLAPASALRPSCTARTVNIPLQQRRHSSYNHLYEELPQRRIPLIYDDLAPLNAHRLNVSLRSFLPAGWPRKRPSPAYHLVYFNPTIPSEELLPDGTDPLQSPGPPFVRRMWAGGYLRFNLNPGVNGLKLDGKRYVCMEGIRNVQIKGKEGDEKVFVGIERRMAPVNQSDNEDSIREKLWREEEDFGEAVLIERRNIVFMRERTPEQLKAAAASRASEKMLKPQHPPDFTHALNPSPSLLFRYSALTFNAHSIHLDPHYCRTVEGHRNLLVHGPLSFTLLTTMLQQHLRTLQTQNREDGANGLRIHSIDYRNLAPLYAEEPLKLCGRKMEPGKYEIWAETPEGGIAVRGIAKTDVPAT